MRDDCVAAMRAMAAEGRTFHAVVTDPPYELKFMGKAWDSKGVAFDPSTWRAAYDLLPPGGHLLTFGGTRTYHRMACAVEDAGFEIRDCIMWLRGQGFPKSRNQRGDWEGWGTALKPACEPIVVARKPLVGTVEANVQAHRTGAVNVDGCRIPTDESITATRNVALGSSSGGIYGAADTPGVYEQHQNGRWPANVAHDGSGEVTEAFALHGESKSTAHSRHNGEFKGVAKGRDLPHVTGGHVDVGTAARFYYCAKASKRDRRGSKHATVKPVALMRWLVRMVTPPTRTNFRVGSG